MAMTTGFAPIAVPARRPARPFWNKLPMAFRIMRERAELARKSDRELADLGLTDEAAVREAARPIWDLPKAR